MEDDWPSHHHNHDDVAPWFNLNPFTDPEWADFTLPQFDLPALTDQDSVPSGAIDDPALAHITPPYAALDGVTQATVCPSSLHTTLTEPHDQKVGVSKTNLFPDHDRQSELQLQALHYVNPSAKVVKPKAEQRRKRGKDGASTSSRRNVMISDQPPLQQVIKDSKGNVVSALQVFGTDQKVRSAQTKERQIATTQSRRIGVCPRCREKKLRCDMPKNPLKPCPRCARLPPELLYAPCIRANLLEINLHRLGTTLDNSVREWMNKQTLLPQSSHRTILLTQEMGSTLEVTVAPFIPEENDTTQYVWTDASGNRKTLDLPQYYIVDMPGALANIQKYGHENAAKYIEALLDGTNTIIWKTFEAACNHVTLTKCPLLTSALNYWAAGRIIERYWRICSRETLGHSPSLDPKNPWAGTIPVPPIMDTQLDEMVIKQLLIPARTTLLQQLKLKIEEKKKENWFAIYLAIFIVLSSVEWMVSDVVDYTAHHVITPKCPGKPSLTESYVHASKTLLAYFHFACGGVEPFNIDFKTKKKLDRIELTLEAIVYIENIQKEIAKQKSRLSGLKTRDMYKTEMFWCYQALDREWQPDAPYNGTIDTLAEEDFLIS